MKVSRPNGASGPMRAGGSQPASAPSGGFRLEAPVSSSGLSRATTIASAAPLGSLDALLALQDIGTPLERRKKAVKRASHILDALDDIKLGLLDGEVSTPTLDKLLFAVREQRPQLDPDPELLGLLDQIETRAMVELAKAEVAKRGL